MITPAELWTLYRYGDPGCALPAALLRAYWELVLEHAITEEEFYHTLKWLACASLPTHHFPK